MIGLRDAVITAPNGRILLAPTTETFLENERIGILAAPSSGKTTMAQALAGLVPPSQGRILRQGQQTTILGQENILHPHMSVAGGLDVAARLLGLDSNMAVRKALKFVDFSLPLSTRLSTLSPIARSELAFALSVQRTDPWIIADDRLLPNSPKLAAKAEQALTLRLKTAGLVLITKNVTQIGRVCDRLFVLAHRLLIPVPDIRMAQTVLATSLEVT
ncbi:MAG: ATP-binding cassette domain-containing protein [Pseudomonadota bacterium]